MRLGDRMIGKGRVGVRLATTTPGHETGVKIDVGISDVKLSPGNQIIYAGRASPSAVLNRSLLRQPGLQFAFTQLLSVAVAVRAIHLNAAAPSPASALRRS